MVSLAGVGIKEYASVFPREKGSRVPEIACPDPCCGGAPLRGHGWYERLVGWAPMAIRRLICGSCKVTHAVLPEDQCAYRDATLEAVEAAVDTGPGHPTAAARAAGQEDSEAVRRVSRWIADFDAAFVQRLCGLLPPVPGTWLERVRAVVGDAAGALVRLRRWLWGRYRVFFGGPSGLWRGGRPRDAACGRSTYGGSNPRPWCGGSPFVRERGWSPRCER